MTRCPNCTKPVHRGVCDQMPPSFTPRPIDDNVIRMTGQERANAERTYLAGMVRRGELEELDRGDTSDLWRDGN
jgi:hypothetical protein